MEGRLGRKAVQQVGADELNSIFRPVHQGVLARDAQRLKRDINSKTSGARQPAGDRDSDTSGTRAHIDKAQIFSPEVSSELDRLLHQELCLRARYQDAGAHTKAQPEKLLVTGDVLQGLPTLPPLYQVSQQIAVSSGQKALRVGEDPHSIAVHDESEKYLCRSPRKLNPGFHELLFRPSQCISYRMQVTPFPYENPRQSAYAGVTTAFLSFSAWKCVTRESIISPIFPSRMSVRL